VKTILALSLASSLVLVSAAARADIPPPNSSDCSSKKAGDACTDDDHKAGTCTNATRTRPNLGMRLDGGGYATVEIPYLQCTPSVGAPSSSSSGGAPGAAPEKKSGCATSPSSPIDAALVLCGVLGALTMRRRKSRA
jgi:hypothetical protein